jgi:ADP-heptose:LPS heptosyltransferase
LGFGEGTMSETDNNSYALPWINPLGGLGDMLMLSGVLKQIYDTTGKPSHNVVRRSRYTSLFQGNPAIAKIGIPPKGATIVGSDYWSWEPLGPGNQRAYQILARRFGIPTPAKEMLYFPPGPDKNLSITEQIPWGSKNVVIAPNSDSPRKMAPFSFWEILVGMLLQKDFFVAQIGTLDNISINGAYSLLGLTTPQEAIEIIKKADVVITVDNFAMHAAHLCGVKAIVIWGPTSSDIYGYAGQRHIISDKGHCDNANACLGPGLAQNYATPCPLKTKQCTALISVEKILESLAEYQLY